MKLGLHAYSLLLAGGLRDYQPVGRGVLTAEQMLDKTVQHKLTAVQMARQTIVDWEGSEILVRLATLRGKAEELGVTLHLSTNRLNGPHLVEMIHAAFNLGAPQVTVGLSHLRGNVQQRQHTLENLLLDLEVAIKAAERHKVVLAIENGRHTATADLAALVQAAQSEWVAACYDMGNALTVPEDPIAGAETLAPYCRSVHLKDVQIYRTERGVMLVNCPLGEGVVPVADTLRVLKAKARHQQQYVFLQTAAERIHIPLLEDEFLQEYPRITARALAGLLRQGTLIYTPEEMQFPHEQKASEREVLKWEEDRLRRSLQQAQKDMGNESLTLSLD